MNDQLNKRPRRGALQQHPPELRERGYRLYKAGKPHAEIAKELGVPVSTLSRWSSTGKWRTRLFVEAGKKNTGARLSHSSDNQAKAYENLTLAEAQNLYESLMQIEAVKFADSLAAMPAALKLASADKIDKLDKVARKALKIETEKPRMAINLRLLAEGKVPRLAIASAVPGAEPPALVEDTGLKPADESPVGASE